MIDFSLYTQCMLCMCSASVLSCSVQVHLKLPLCALNTQSVKEAMYDKCDVDYGQ